MEESIGGEGLEFKWGKKRGIGGKKKDVQFYESFTFDGDEYRLYDCILVGESETAEPFVGMIIKIWENSNKRAKFLRQVKLLWFFKPSEISQYLEEVPSNVLPNELFLASGEGPGLANVNPLEAIGGKCSVVCISKDERNPQPSDEKLKSADFVFRRAFDVGSFKFLDKFDDKIAGVDVKLIFNRPGCEKEATAVPKIEPDINMNPDSLKPNGLLASGPVRKTEDNSVEADLNGSPDSLKPNGPSASGPVRKTEDNSVEADLNGNPDRLKPNGPVRKTEDKSIEAECLKPNDLSANGRVRKTEDNSIESSDCKESSHGCEEEKEKGHSQLRRKKSTLVEKKSNKDSGVEEGMVHNKGDSCEASGSKGNRCDGKAQEREVKKKSTDPVKKIEDNFVEADLNGSPDSLKPNGSSASGHRCDGKAQESEVKKKFTKQKTMPAEERYRNSCEASGSRVNHSSSKKADVRKELSKQKSMPVEERCSKESNGLDDRPQKKQKLDGSVTVADGRKISSDGKKETGSFKRPRDKVTTREEVSPEKPVKKRDLGVSVSEGKDTKTATEKGLLSKRTNSDGKVLKRYEDKMLADDYERNYQVIEVSRKPDAGNSKWFRPLPWEERMREAETLETLVLLQNLDPTITSDEVEDIVYSALNEQCTARMVPCTSATTPHIGQALVIFNSREAAEKAIKRLEDGCLLLSNGRPLVASLAKINPPGKPTSFVGHIKLLKTLMRREMREAVSTSHHAQPNTLEYDMSMEWCLHQTRCKQAIQTVSKRQLEEKKAMRINFKPKLP